MAIICNTKVEGDVGELLAKLVSQTTEAIVCVECSTHTIVLYNSGAEQIFGYTTEEMLGTPVERIMPVQERKDSRIQTTGTRKDGTTFPLDIVVSTVELNGSDYCAVIARDAESDYSKELAEYRKTTKQQLLKEVDSLSEIKTTIRT